MNEKLEILFVCTGNTCRSPMAEAIFDREIKQRGLGHLFKSQSAGIFADSSPLSSGAKNALSRLGINDFSHTAVKLTEEMLNSAHLVLCMTRSHRAYINMPNAYTLYEFAGECGDVSDPYGSNDAVYYNTALELEELISKIVDKLESALK